MFRFECVCGRQIQAGDRDGTCSQCGREYRIVWPVPVDDPAPEPAAKTITEKYEQQ